MKRRIGTKKSFIAVVLFAAAQLLMLDVATAQAVSAPTLSDQAIQIVRKLPLMTK